MWYATALKAIGKFIWMLLSSKVFWSILAIVGVLGAAVLEGYHLAKDGDAKTISDLNGRIVILKQKDIDDVKAIQFKWDAQKLADAQLTARKTVALEQAHQKVEGELNAKISTIKSKLDTALNSVSVLSRQSRPTHPIVVNPAAPISYCSGLQLFRQDAEFLIKQAGLSDQIVAERDACYAQYQKVSEIVSSSTWPNNVPSTSMVSEQPVSDSIETISQSVLAEGSNSGDTPIASAETSSTVTGSLLHYPIPNENAGTSTGTSAP